MGKGSIGLSKNLDGKDASANAPAAGFFFFAVVLALSAEAAAQDSVRVGSVAFDAPPGMVAGGLDSALTLRSGSVFNERSLRADSLRVLSLWHDGGFLDARIDSIERRRAGGTVDVRIRIAGGYPAVVESLRVENQTPGIPSSPEASISMPAGGRFSKEAIESEIESVLGDLENSGYPFARIVVQRVNVRRENDTSRVDVVLGVDRGPLVRVSQVRITGNTTTKDYVISRAIRLEENEVYRSDLAPTIRRRLEQLQLFSSVSDPQLYLTESSAGGILIQVAEGASSTFDGVVGYVPSPGPGLPGYATGLVDMQFRNLLGTGRKLAARWFRENQSTQELELNYLEPWVANLPLNAGVGYFQRKQDSTYVLSRYDGRVDFMITDALTLGGLISTSTTIPAQGYGSTVVAESRTTNIGASVRYDSRDVPANPTRGFLYQTEYATGIKTISQSPIVPSSMRNSTQRVTMDFLTYVRVVGSEVLATEVHLRDYSSASLDESDMFRLGGASTLRGYREGQFLGSRVAWANFEYRFLSGRRSFVYGFLDEGYIAQPAVSVSGTPAFHETKTGYGLGVRLDTAVGVIGVSIGFGEGDTFSTAKLHFRLINEF